MEFSVAYMTDVGIRKKTNQDALLIKEGSFQKESLLFAAVCDGMGGLSKGEVASAEVIRALSAWFERTLPEILSENPAEEALKKSLEELVRQENDVIAQYGRKSGVSLGTTVTTLLLWKSAYYIIHVGDSRVYEFSDKLYQMTEDQTFVAKEIAAGRMTEEEGETDARRSVLLQCVGASEILNPAFYSGKIQPEARYLICSDGFRHEIRPAELWRELKGETGQTEEAMREKLREVTELLKEREEKDNISGILVQTRD